MQTLRSIVVGTDYSECSDHALEAAIALAALTDARITLVHVCALSAEQGLPDELATQALDDTRLQACREALATTVARHARSGVLLTALVRTGRPAEKLGNVAAEVGAGLIVVGRNGAGRGVRDELGSTSERVMRTATRPVLVIPCDQVTRLALEAP